MKYRVMLMVEAILQVDDSEVEIGGDDHDIVRDALMELEDPLHEMGITVGSTEHIERIESD